MKNVIQAAILIAAVPALLSAQQFDCPEATCQIAPYFGGSGGFVGEAAHVDDATTPDDESEVSFRVVCGNRTATGSVTPDSAGVVRQALTEANGYACEGDSGGTMEIAGLQDGGWYWINDDTNSAVSALIRKDSLEHPHTTPTNPGGVILRSVEGGAATFAKHEPSGRVGIIPHIVPRKPLPGCSGEAGSATAADCILGSTADWSLTADPSSVTRPTGLEDDVELTVTLAGRGFITTGTVAAIATLDIHSSVVAVVLGNQNGAEPAADETGVLKWTLTVSKDDNRCLPANNNPDRLNAQTVGLNVATVDQVIPGVPADGLKATFTVNCHDDPQASAGAELVPENPFPVDE